MLEEKEQWKEEVERAYHEAEQYFTHLMAYEFASLEPYFIAITNARMLLHKEHTKEEYQQTLEMVKQAKERVIQIHKSEEVCIYLWGSQMPATREYLMNDDHYRDDPGFRPFIMRYPVPEGIPVQGAMLIGSGGGRNTMQEGYYYAEAFANMGYECFILCYRLAPYTNMDAAADVQRAVRLVRSMAGKLGYSEDRIVLIGNSGSSVCSAFVNNYFYGNIQPTIIDSTYCSDKIDLIDSTVNAQIHTALVPWELKNPNYPPSFFVVGCDDPNIDRVYQMADVFQKFKIPVEVHTFLDVPHAFLMGRDSVTGAEYSNIACWKELAGEWLKRLFTLPRKPFMWKKYEPEANQLESRILLSGKKPFRMIE